MHHTKISTPNAPAAIGPYNQAIRYGQFVYTSGQIALDPATGELSGDDVQSQTHRVLQNLQAVLNSAGTSLAGGVKTTVFLIRMSGFKVINIYIDTYF